MTLPVLLLSLACAVAFLWRVRCAYDHGYRAGYLAGEADAYGQALDHAEVICRDTLQSLVADEYERRN